ncbi:hypothetical protein [Flavobacterium silvaticum]|uniref:YD repeat-containing protein n=1 Tax=Flavobacterium silvaticum TaxID=1852020 RepID=A0A972FNH6_9FLAO|nr:hypothetical protein [Flavobacterium silvaticum]NMH28495.1 hypothetical protein [Flavobacterium silvaticum]
MNNFYLIILFILFGGYTSATAQKSNDYTDIIPMTPESYSFKKRFNNEISSFSGQTNVDIPIYTIEMDDIQIPISISYNSGGIRVEEEATIVGLGWHLNIGGEISRKNNGAPDERSFVTTDYNSNAGLGTLKNPIVYINYDDYITKYFDRQHLCRDAIYHSDPYLTYQGTVDTRPDEFFFSALGESCSFMYNQQFGNYLGFPITDTKLSHTLQYMAGYGNVFYQLKAKLSTGTEVTFGEDARSSVRRNGGNYFDNNWKIKKIKSIKNNLITYDYTYCEYASGYRTTYAGYIGDVPYGAPAPVNPGSAIGYMNREALISQINFPNGNIKFVYDTREDLMTGAKRLKEIKVYQRIAGVDQLVKTFRLNQTYFVSTQTASNSNYPGLDETRKKRLRLDGIDVVDSDNVVGDKHSFEYFVFDKIPSKDSGARDAWGYFNGDFYQSLEPKMYNSSCTQNCYPKIDETYTKTFSLKKITYPEGGYATYDYELHKIDGDENSYAFTLLKDITDEMYEYEWKSLSISGYALNNYNPTPVADQYYPYRIHYLTGEQFEIDSTVLPSNQDNLTINSTLYTMIPGYQTYVGNNYAKCTLEKWNGTSWATTVSQTISKDFNPSGNFSTSYVPSPGSYRFKIELNQSYLTSTGTVNPSWNINVPHSTGISLKLKRMTNKIIRIGGLRVKEINSYSPEHASKTSYSYNFTNGKPSGKVTFVPSFWEYVNQKYEESPMDSNPNLVIKYFQRISSESTLPMSKTKGTNVGYKRVVKTDIDITDPTKTISTEYLYSFANQMFSSYYYNMNLMEFEPNVWQSGKLMQKSDYANGVEVKRETYDYYGLDLEQDKGYVDDFATDYLNLTEFENQVIPIQKHIPSELPNGGLFNPINLFQPDVNGIMTAQSTWPPSVRVPYFKRYSGFDKIKSKLTTNYFPTGAVTQLNYYFYDAVPAYTGISREEYTSSSNDAVMTKYYYPQNMMGEPLMTDLVNANRVGEPVKIESYKNSFKISEERTVFAQDATTSNYLLPKYIYKAKFPNNFPVINTVPLGNLGQLERKMTFDQYDNQGNLIQYTSEFGIPTAILWGYNKSLPMAKFENATFSLIESVASSKQTTSNASYSESNEQLLRDALNAMRSASNLQNSMITVYTYKPLVGMSSVTDEKGNITFYKYDSQGRLKHILDNGGKILKEFTYHLKQ